MNPEDLRKFHKLKEDGILSEEEFQAEKKKLLEQSSASVTTSKTTSVEVDNTLYAMFIHLSLLLGVVFPLIGLIATFVLWLVRKEDPYVNQNGRIVFNWLISSAIYSIVGFVLLWIVIGAPILMALVICHIVFAIIGAIKAKDGVAWSYPLSIKFLKV